MGAGLLSQDGNQPQPGFEGAGASEQAMFASSRRVGVTTDSLLRLVGDDVEIAGGSSFVVRSPEMSSLKTSLPKGSIYTTPKLGNISFDTAYLT